MNTFDSIIQEIARVTYELEGKTLEQLALKTGEECGELQQAVLSVVGAPGCKYKGKTQDDIDEEAVDTIICALATALKERRGVDRLITVFERKIEKWKEKCRE